MNYLDFGRLRARAFTMIEAIVTLVIILLLSLLLIPQFTGQANDAADSQARASAQAALSSAAALYQSTGELPGATALSVQDPDVSFVNAESSTVATSVVSVGVSSDGTVFAAAVPGGGTNCWMVQWNTNDTTSQTPTIYAKESTATSGFNCEAIYALRISQCPQTPSNNGNSWTTPLVCTFDSSSTSTTTPGSTTTTSPTTTIAETLTPPYPSVIENTYASTASTMAWSWPGSTGGTGTVTYHWSLSPTAGSACASGTTTATELTCANELTPGTTYTLSVYAQDSLNYTSAVAQVQATASSVTTTTASGTTTTTAVTALSNPTLTLTSNVYGSMTWAWPGSTGGTGTVTYHWQLSPWTNTCTNGSTTATSFTCSSVTPGTVYTLSLYAQDAVGDDSQVVSHTDQATATSGGTGPTTTLAGPSTPVPSVSSNTSPPTGLGSQNWAWPVSTGGTGTVIYYWSLSPQVSGCTTGQTESTSFTCANELTPGTAYTFAVFAQDQSGHTSGVGSITQTQNVRATVPGTPTAVVGVGAQNQSSSVSWTAPTNTGGYPITDYSIQYSVAPYTTWTSVTVSAAHSPHTVTGLTNGTPYEFEVAATNSVGTGSWSAASASVIPSAVPGAPTGVTATDGVNVSSQVSWTTPASNGGAIVTGYTVTSSPGSLTCTSNGATTCDVTGLTNGTSYTFTVTATNASGISAPSAPSSSITPEPDVPTAPLGPSATALYQSAQVSWSAPANNGGDPVTLYTVTSTPGSLTCTSASSPCTVTGLSDGNSYTFVVTATNAIGTGPASVPTAAVTPSTTPPGAPSISSVVAGNASATITYVAPTYTGGSVVTSYQVLAAPSPYSSFASVTTSPSTCTTTTCVATGLTNGTTYEFEVAATNSVGTGASSAPSAAVTPMTIPGAPSGVVGSIADTSSTVSWSAPSSNGGSPVSLYTVTSTPGSFTCTSASSPCTVTGLTDGTSYTFSVTATNTAGTGPASAPSAPVVPAHVPGTPTGLSATGANASVSLTWSAPASDGGTAITSYVILVATSPYTAYNIATSSPATCTTTACTATGLTNGTPYEFEVEAVNSVGTGPPSAPSAPTVPITTPGPPTGVTATSNANASSVISWSAPSSNGGATVTKYAVLYATSPYSTYSLLTSSSAGTSYTATGLTNGTPYEFEVEATNAAGTGPASAPSDPATPATTPGAPSSVTASSNASTQSVVSWTAPSSNGGAAVTSYTVLVATSPYSSFSAATTSPSTCITTSCTVTGLTNGTPYEFEVVANNPAGTGPASAPSAPATPATVPGAPSASVALVGNLSSQVSWTAPSTTGGTAISLYTVTSSPGGFTCTTSTTSCTVSGLTNGTSYTFSVTATNAAGTGPASGPSNAVTPAPVPSAPLAPTATGANASASVSWTTPLSNGGSPITGYTVTSSPGGFTCTTSGLTCTVSGLTNGTSYTFEVAATNANGSGPNSSATSPVTPYTFAGAPSSVTASSNASTQSVVSWTAPATNGGSVITAYVVQYATSPYSSWSVATSSASGTSYTVTGLTNGTPYEFEVAAVNAEGTGPYSSPSTPATPATIPGAPSSVTASSNASTQSVVSWTAPSSNGGAAVTSYTVLVATSPYSSFSAATTSPSTCITTSCTVTGLTNGTPYEFEVVANNPAGTGPASAPSAPATPATVPGAPSSLVCTSNTNQSSLSSWTTPSSNGGTSITGYIVQYAPSPYTSWTTATSSASSPYTITGLANGTAYECQVAAINAAGTGSYTSPVSFTPAAAPSAPTSLVTAPGNGQVTLQWQAPASNGGATITSYNVTTTGGSCSTSGTLTCTVTGLTNGTSYTFSVTATNSAGTGPAATATATPATVPGAPSALSGVTSDSQVALTWTAPASNGGATISSYTVLIATSPYSVFTPATTTSPATCTTTSCTVTGLTDGTGYQFEVEAVNVMGNSPASTATSTITPEGAPGAPTGVVGAHANASVTLTWTAPTVTGGSSINAYTATSSPGGFTCSTSGATGCTVTGLTNGTAYTFSVTATNALGYTGPASSSSASVTPSTTPGTPQGFSASSGSNSQSSLSWAAPSTNGGAAISGYTVTSSPSTSGCSTSSTSCVVTGLSNGIAYTFYVVATNINGSGGAASAAATPYTVPNAPTSVSAYDPGSGDGELTVSWAAPASNGAAITSYMASASGYTCTTSGTSCTIYGLAYSTGYTIYVYATNAAGTGAPGVGSGTTSAAPVTTPAPYESSTANTGTYSAMVFNWGASTGGNGSFTYYYSGACSGSTTSTSATCTSLTPGTYYTLSVYAQDSVGDTSGTGTSASAFSATLAPPNSGSGISAGIGLNTAEGEWFVSGYAVTGVDMHVYKGTCATGTEVHSDSSSYSASSNTMTGFVTSTGTNFYSPAANYDAYFTISNAAGTDTTTCFALGTS